MSGNRVDVRLSVPAVPKFLVKGWEESRKDVKYLWQNCLIHVLEAPQEAGRRARMREAAHQVRDATSGEEMGTHTAMASFVRITRLALRSIGAFTIAIDVPSHVIKGLRKVSMPRVAYGLFLLALARDLIITGNKLWRDGTPKFTNSAAKAAVKGTLFLEPAVRAFQQLWRAQS